MLVTQAEFAKTLPSANGKGVSQAYVSKLKKAGKLVMEGEKVNLEKSLEKIRKNTDPARYLNTPEIKGSLLDTGEPQAPSDNAPNSDSESFSAVRARREKALAETAEFELQRKLGMYLPKEEVVDAMVQAGRKIRQQLDAITEWADELTSLFSAGAGAEDVRKFLKTKVRALEQKTADTLADQKIIHTPTN